MPLSNLTIKTGAQVTKPNPSLISQDGVASLVYGTSGTAGNVEQHFNNSLNGNDKALDSDRLGTVNSTTVISVTGWREFVDQINAERARRGYLSMEAGLRSAINADAKISHEHFNSMRTGIQIGPGLFDIDQAYATDNSITITTYPLPSAPSSATEAVQNGVIYASDVNKLVADVNGAGRACICNCNYCSCNCNYCTCNCNYSCTCNCNYSDVTTKENIVYM
jgi:hypothetical protein